GNGLASALHVCAIVQRELPDVIDEYRAVRIRTRAATLQPVETARVDVYEVIPSDQSDLVRLLVTSMEFTRYQLLNSLGILTPSSAGAAMSVPTAKSVKTRTACFEACERCISVLHSPFDHAAELESIARRSRSSSCH